jgi:heme exporter protein A
LLDSVDIARGGFSLFSGLSATIEAGEHAAIVGPNGAGKTSLLRALAGLLVVRGGEIRIEPDEDIVHFLGHRDGLKPNLSARAHAEFWRDLFGGAGDVDQALARVGLLRQADLPARALSAGQSRRLALTRLLTAPRSIWLLDEPAAALDAGGKAFLADLLAEHRRSGGIVIAAVHEPLGEPSQRIDLGAMAQAGEAA